MTTTEQLFRPVPGTMLQEAIHDLGITHVVTVPDTHQRTLLNLLYEDPKVKMVTVSTEDEALGIIGGLYAGGAKPILLIQHVGFFAGMNSLRGIAQDYRIPTPILVGMFGHDSNTPIEESSQSAARLLEPLMDSVGVPHWRLNGPEDIGVVKEAYETAQETMGPAAVIVVARTS
jgi:sulfopyruvate decarboxylase TPP-binding subunit